MKQHSAEFEESIFRTETIEKAKEHNYENIQGLERRQF